MPDLVERAARRGWPVCADGDCRPSLAREWRSIEVFWPGTPTFQVLVLPFCGPHGPLWGGPRWDGEKWMPAAGAGGRDGRAE